MSSDMVASSESVLRILGMQEREHCGYCRTDSGSRFFALRARTLSCSDYQQLVDRGWRRSGSLLYLTDMSDSCCPYYTIRTRALEFQPSNSDKKLARRWRNYLGAPVADNPDRMMFRGGQLHSLDVRLGPAEFSEEKYCVFEKYQTQVHHETDTTRARFRRFLCDSPLENKERMGSFHQCYYIDGQLMGVGVLDVLPKCISSVYFFYDPAFAHLSPGTYSAMRELMLVKQMHMHMPTLQYYYMGYFIPSCPKMAYKKHWRPAELLDVTTFKWFPMEDCLRRIAQHPVFCSFDPEIEHRGLVRNSREERLQVAPVFGPELVEDPEEALGFIVLVDVGDKKYAPVLASQLAKVYEWTRPELLRAVAGLSNDLAHQALILL